MKESFWDNVADRYDEEIFNTLVSDRSQTLAGTVRRYATGANLACDFGCGVGRFVPLLAECAEQVLATDFSARSLDVARQSVPKKTAAKVTFEKHDLCKSKQRFCKANVGICINVMIMPDASRRQSILDNVRRNLEAKGRLILAVPAYESALFSCQRLLEWYCRAGDDRAEALRELEAETRESTLSIVDGIVEIQGEATKHYLREELLCLFDRNRLNVLEELRIEYDWREDFKSPPKWMKEPWPWDWLFVVEKR